MRGSPTPRSVRLRWLLLDLLARVPVAVLVALNVCPCCYRHAMTVGRRPTRTAYPDPESNFETSCVDCYEEHDEIWTERWQEYYAGCL